MTCQIRPTSSLRFLKQQLDDLFQIHVQLVEALRLRMGAGETILMSIILWSIILQFPRLLSEASIHSFWVLREPTPDCVRNR
jgi:hypothetical protein